MTLEPASAVAAGKCLAARLWNIPTHRDQSPDAFHPKPCAWEDYTSSDLAHLVTDFNDEAGYDVIHERYRSVAVERFHALPRDRQARLVRAAQYPDEVMA